MASSNQPIDHHKIIDNTHISTIQSDNTSSPYLKHVQILSVLPRMAEDPNANPLGNEIANENSSEDLKGGRVVNVCDVLHNIYLFIDKTFTYRHFLLLLLWNPSLHPTATASLMEPSP